MHVFAHCGSSLYLIDIFVDFQVIALMTAVCNDFDIDSHLIYCIGLLRKLFKFFLGQLLLSLLCLF
jgi:hypothetical protein